MKNLLTRLKTAFSKPAPEPARQQEHPQNEHQPHEPQSDAAEDEVLINAYCTVWDLPALDFAHTLAGRRDLADPELAPHLSGFVGKIGRQLRVRKIAAPDRKSTRLNSSHTCISYAVFCLQKKTRNYHTPLRESDRSR